MVHALLCKWKSHTELEMLEEYQNVLQKWIIPYF